MTDDNGALTPGSPGDDPELFVRWLTIEHLLTSAREVHGRGGGAWPSLAVISADAATETMLFLVAMSSENPPPDRAKFEDVYSSAVQVLRDKHGTDVSPSLRARIVGSHRARNAAIHEGNGPSPTTVRSSIKAATDLRDLIVSVLPTLLPFGGAGPIEAIAKTVDLPSISDPLAEAERLLNAGDVKEAADSAAVALDRTLRQAKPPMRSPYTRRPFGQSVKGLFNKSRAFGTGYPSPFAEAERYLDDVLTELDDRVDHHEVWILATGLGLRPTELSDLQRLLGRASFDGYEMPTVHRGADVNLTREAVETALLATADVIYRAWQAGMLSPAD